MPKGVFGAQIACLPRRRGLCPNRPSCGLEKRSGENEKHLFRLRQKNLFLHNSQSCVLIKVENLFLLLFPPINWTPDISISAGREEGQSDPPFQPSARKEGTSDNSFLLLLLLPARGEKSLPPASTCCQHSFLLLLHPRLEERAFFPSPPYHSRPTAPRSQSPLYRLI